MLTSSFCLLHTARAMQQLLQIFNWKVLYHPAHSPDLPPSNFHLFLHLQIFNWKVLYHPAHSPDLPPSNFHLFLHLRKRLASQKFHEAVKNEITTWLHAQAAEFCDVRI
jgi:hypothetical protein